MEDTHKLIAPFSLEVAGIAAITKQLDSYRQALKELEVMKSELSKIPRRIAEVITDQTQRVRYAHTLYWKYEEIPAEPIAKDLLGGTIHELLTKVGREYSDLRCGTCSERISFLSREQKRSWFRDYKNSRLTDNQSVHTQCQECRSSNLTHPPFAPH